MKMVALLRGINVGGNRKVPMTELCALAGKAGLAEVKSYINSGNLVFDAGKLKAEKVAALLEAGIEKQFGFSLDVIVRTGAQWDRYADGSPFAKAARERPHLLHLGLARRPIGRGAAAILEERASSGEKIAIVGEAIWVDFANGVAKSKLTAAVFDKAAGSTVTLRNWNTVLKLQELLALKRPAKA